MSKFEIRSASRRTKSEKDVHDETFLPAAMTLEDTRRFAEDMAARTERGARIFALTGELGAGKTTFSQFFLRALGVTGPLTSPTFVIMKTYPLSGHGHSSVSHIDCYRLAGTDELRALGFEARAADPSVILLVEWADRAKEAIPPDAVWIDFSHGARDGERMITERSK